VGAGGLLRGGVGGQGLVRETALARRPARLAGGTGPGQRRRLGGVGPVNTEPDWIREHGGDLIEVKLIDLLSLVARLEQVEREELAPPDILIERLFTCDLPRLRRYLPSRALEEL
jgi:hypothetical protein